jgi:CheY-like chemotaxis protein
MAVILVVDDEPTISSMVAELVEEHGHTALRARHGVEALELAREHLPALIISDVMMPVMNGYALLVSVRMSPELQNTPVYLMSAAMTNYLGRYIEIQPDGFIPKPLDFSALDAVLELLHRQD